MPTTDVNALQARFDDFSRRLRARSEEFQRSGEFSDVHRSLLDQIQQRRDRLAEKLAAAEKSGDKRELIDAECARDFEGLHDELLLLEERLSAEDIRQSKA